MGSLIFVTGTDTGVGKTLVTALLLHHLRVQGVKALAMKPFAAGSIDDTRLLWRMQERQLCLKDITPFYFPQPLAPGVQRFPSGKHPSLSDVVRVIRETQARCEVLLVEGCGGVMVPLGNGYLIADLIEAMKCPVLLVAANRLGAINHVLLSLRAMEKTRSGKIQVILSALAPGNRLVKRSNEQFLRKSIHPEPLISLEFMGKKAGAGENVKKGVKKFKKALALIIRSGNLLELFGANREKNGGPKNNG